jgi:hypothetical protein
MADNSPTRPRIRDGHNNWGQRLITEMPTQSTITQIRLDNIGTALNAAVTTVEVISNSLETPFLKSIVITMWSLLTAVQVPVGHSGSMGLTNSG